MHLNFIGREYNCKISTTKKRKIMAFWYEHKFSKVHLEGTVWDQVTHFRYFGWVITCRHNQDIDNKLPKFSRICGVIKVTLGRQCIQEILMQLYKIMAVPALTYCLWCLERKIQINYKMLRWSFCGVWWIRYDGELNSMMSKRKN